MDSMVMCTHASRCPQKCRLDRGLRNRKELHHRNTMDTFRVEMYSMHMASVCDDDESSQDLGCDNAGKYYFAIPIPHIPAYIRLEQVDILERGHGAYCTSCRCCMVHQPELSSC
jgi:hypothetical protein